ncbi:MAG: hypothetical protein KI785_01205 [Devosiaceae bacterium]|nr:hypothetical protein [Devosiaceae bacterium MH13]
MPIFAETFDDNLEARMEGNRIKALYRRYLSEQQLVELDGEGALPSLSSIAADRYLGLEDWIIRMVALESGDYVYEAFGAEISGHSGLSMVGKRLSDCRGRPFEFFRTCYDRVLVDRKPLFAVSAAVLSPRVGRWGRLVLPVLDDAGRQHVISVLQPVSREAVTLEGLLEAVTEPAIVVQMVRSQGEDVIDARVTALNEPAKEVLGVQSLKHLHLSDIAPQLLNGPRLTAIKQAYAGGTRVECDNGFTLRNRWVSMFSATRAGDGAVLLLQTQPLASLENWQAHTLDAAEPI